MKKRVKEINLKSNLKLLLKLINNGLINPEKFYTATCDNWDITLQANHTDELEMYLKSKRFKKDEEFTSFLRLKKNTIKINLVK